MKKIACAATLVLACSAVSGLADDSDKKQTKTPWDIAFGGALMSDYIIRGISGSNHRPAANAYFEPRYNFSDSLQFYGRVLGQSIALPNRAGIAMEFYAGARPTFGKLDLDFGVWEHWLVGGQCINPGAVGGLCGNPVQMPSADVIRAQWSFVEVFAKAIYNVDTKFSWGGNVFWTPSVLNVDEEATYVSGTAKYILPTVLPQNIGWFISADLGHWFREMTPYKSYTNWDVGLAFTWKQFTLDLRYSDTSQHDCVTPQMTNDLGRHGDLCKATFIAKLSFDLTRENLK